MSVDFGSRLPAADDDGVAALIVCVVAGAPADTVAPELEVDEDICCWPADDVKLEISEGGLDVGVVTGEAVDTGVDDVEELLLVVVLLLGLVLVTVSFKPPELPCLIANWSDDGAARDLALLFVAAEESAVILTDDEVSALIRPAPEFKLF